jgi:hypothetical protein
MDRAERQKVEAKGEEEVERLRFVRFRVALGRVAVQ